MLDLTNMTPKQQEALFRLFEITAANPLEMLKMNFLNRALDFKEWVEKNTSVNKQQLNIRWSGLEHAVNRDFKEAQRHIAQKCAIKLIE